MKLYNDLYRIINVKSNLQRTLVIRTKKHPLKIPSEEVIRINVTIET